jgi:hypothetical protein
MEDIYGMMFPNKEKHKKSSSVFLCRF